MFDVEKVRRMTDELEKFARTHGEIFLTFESMTGDAIALFHRLKINVRAIMFDATSKRTEVDGAFFKNSLREEFQKLPALKTSEATKIFSERTGIIAIIKKPLPFFQTELPFVVNNRRLLVPTFIFSPDEISAMYERLMLSQVLQRYAEDGISAPPNVLAQRFARGLTTSLEPNSQNVKIQFSDRNKLVLPRFDFDDTAIVIQGPLVYENNYTAETLKLYRKIYPNAHIVISTWTGEATAEFRETCRKNSVALLENVMPANHGHGHVNLQITSSFQGVNFVRENTSAKFIFKTRTDQRINRPDFLTYFKNLLETFPVKGDRLNRRIIVPGNYNTCLRIPFHVCDYFSFGTTDDLHKLYDVPLQTNEAEFFKRHDSQFLKIRSILARCELSICVPEQYKFKLKKFNRLMARLENAEIFIMKSFYRTHIAPIEADRFLETYYEFLRDYLLVADEETLLLDWPKYERYRYEMNSCLQSFWWQGGMDFSRWLDLYGNFRLDWV